MTQLELRALVIFCALCLACTTPFDSTHAARDVAAGDDTISIAVVPFGLASGSPPPPCDVAEIIRDELGSVDRIATVAVSELPGHPTRLAEVDFETWRGSKADLLVVGLVAGVHDGGHEVEFRLIDPHTEATLVGYLMPSAPDALAETAHSIADLIMLRIDALTAADLARTGRGDRSHLVR
jgi:Tol biopolymer transport system component